MSLWNGSSHTSLGCIRTKVNSHTSSSSPITSGVPQGSVLGPVLFLIYYMYKDIPAVIAAITALFADDTLLFHPACHGSKTFPCCPLQADLDALASCAADLNVSFNPLKSVDFCLGPYPSQEVLQVDGVATPQRKEARHRGVSVLNFGPALEQSRVQPDPSFCRPYPSLPEARVPAPPLFIIGHQAILHSNRPPKARVL